MGDVEQSNENNKESMIEQLAQAFLELEAQKGASEDKVQWDEIKQHFSDLEMALDKKNEELQAKEREYEEKQLEMNTLLTQRKAAVTSKEQDLLDRLQELKDTAVAAIIEARPNDETTTFDFVYDGEDKDKQVSISPEDSPNKSGEKSEGVATEVRPHLDLKVYCEKMDATGLLDYVVAHKKKMSEFREEVSVALESATDPARLVLDLLLGFYPDNETSQQNDNVGAALQGKRKSCILILEAMASLLARADPGTDHLLNPETKQQAKAIADEWRLKLASSGIDAANGNSLEAEAFLQLLSTYRIASEFDEEELCKLVPAVAQNRSAPELCRSIGLTHKVPALIEALINNGKHIAAVHFVQLFKLQESFPPVPLLRTYLKNQRRNSQVKADNVRDIATAKIDANAQELAALRNVIKCIEEYEFESEYPLDTLHKRVHQLEKAKTEKRRGGDFFKRPQPSKRPRPNERHFPLRSSGRGSASAVVTGRQVPPVRTAYAGTADRYPHYAAVAHDYQVPGQSIYTQPASATPPNYGRYIGSSLQSTPHHYM